MLITLTYRHDGEKERRAMGLDIYLYHYEDHERANQAKEIYDKRSEDLWGKKEKYEDFTDAEKEEIRKELKGLQIELGYTFKKGNVIELDYAPGETVIELNSNKYPEHMFKVGYFRSSYNESGIEQVIPNFIDHPCLRYIFNAGDEYEFSPDWEAALAKTKQVISMVNEKLKEGSYGVMTMPLFLAAANDPAAAMKIFLNELKEGRSSFDSYSNRHGDFFMKEPLKVHAAISGKQYGQPCVYLIIDSEVSWYQQALEIVQETIEYVLAQDDPQKYYLHWSG